MSSTHKDFRFSVTIFTDDLALLHCLRSLSQHAQLTGNARIPWGGTKREDWEQNAHKATFRFSFTDYRKAFIANANRLLPSDLWRIVSTSDDDPALPQASH